MYLRTWMVTKMDKNKTHKIFSGLLTIACFMITITVALENILPLTLCGIFATYMNYDILKSYGVTKK